MKTTTIQPNNVINDDCLTVLPQIPDKSIDLVVTDPPYLHTKGRGINRKTGKAYNDGHSPFANSELFSTKGFMMGQMSSWGEEKINKTLDELVRVCKIPNIYVFCNETQVPFYGIWANKHELMFSILIWEKPLSIINRNRFSQNIEFVIRIYDYGTALNRLDGCNQIYNRVRRVAPVQNKVHPTQKPVELVESFILLSSNVGDTILDPFMGSGSTYIACVKNERNFIGIEKEKRFCEIAKTRIKDYNAQLKLF